MTDEEIVKALYRVADCIRFTEMIGKLNNCNDCGKKNTCEHRPEWGQTVRYNCFEWEEQP